METTFGIQCPYFGIGAGADRIHVARGRSVTTLHLCELSHSKTKACKPHKCEILTNITI